MQKQKSNFSNFQPFESRCPCIYFIGAKEKKFNPVELAKNFLKTIESDGPKTRYTSKLIPIQIVCPADISIVLRKIDEMLSPLFQATFNKSVNYMNCRSFFLKPFVLVFNWKQKTKQLWFPFKPIVKLYPENHPCRQKTSTGVELKKANWLHHHHWSRHFFGLYVCCYRLPSLFKV